MAGLKLINIVILATGVYGAFLFFQFSAGTRHYLKRNYEPLWLSLIEA